MRARLSVSLDHLRKNYAFLRDHCGAAICAAVVKADAYGLGAHKIAPALYEAGARHFFVALMEEGIALRGMLPEDAVIYVLNGLLPNEEATMRQYHLLPVINSTESAKRWHGHACAIQLDTGLNRLGFLSDEWAALDKSALDIRVILTHLACADTPDHPMNVAQRQRFDAAMEHMIDRNVMRSIAASDGIFCGESFHYDMVRPGAALYGVNPIPNRDNPMLPVVTLEAPVLGIHAAPQDGTIGYAATRHIAAGQMVAAIGLGYADGFFRSQSNSGTLYFQGRALPVLGRVSMDIVLVDISALPTHVLQVGDFVEVIGKNQTIDALAVTGGTIGYEVLTALGSRFDRHYIDG